MIHEVICPYCNHTSPAFGTHKKKFDGPCRKCEHCQHTVIDPTVIEWAIYPFWKKVKVIIFRPAMIGAVAIPIVLYLIRPSLFEVLAYFALFVAIVIGSGLSDAYHSKNKSLWRTENLSYVRALIGAGYPVSRKTIDRILALGNQIPVEDWGKMMLVK